MAMSESLKLSIVTPSYNHGRFLEKSILSVINQDYSSVEHIVIDGASQDNSVQIIRKHSANIAYWVSEPDEDLRFALQKGFSHATGDVMAWQNADDYYEPHIFREVMDIFCKYPEVDLVYGNVNIVDENNKMLEKLFHIPLCYPLDIFGGMPLQSQAAFFRRTLWEKVGGIQFHELNYDVDLIFRMVKFSNSYFLHRAIGNYRNHSNSLSFSGQSDKLQKDFWVIRRRFLGKWGKFSDAFFAPVVVLAKIRRYLWLMFLGDWEYFLQQTQKILRRMERTKL